MTNSSVLVPVVTLASICVCMFVFIWWWFPRHYKKGLRQDVEIIDSEQAGRDAIHAGLEGEGDNLAPARPKTLEEHIAIARANIRRGHNPAATPY
jgi:hypothetical protein